MNSLIKYKIKKSKTFGKCQDSPFMCTVVSHQVVGGVWGNFILNPWFGFWTAL